MDGLGRAFNIVPTAAGVEVNCKDAAVITFVCVGADTYTVQEAQDAAGTGAQNLAAIHNSYNSTSAAGAAAWTEVEHDPAVKAVTVAASNVRVFTVDTKALSDGYTHVKVNAAGTGLVYAIAHDLEVQRNPANLPALAV